jgi:Tfp pilus assembly protein PilF
MSIFLIAAMLGAAEPSRTAELEYDRGSLAFEALVQGDLKRAEQQLSEAGPAIRNDGAWLLNYGQLLARSGRVNEASAVFRRVADAPDSEIVLGSGEVMGTREASRRALQRLRLSGISSR